MRVYAIGGEDAPSKGTPDPEILAWVEARNCLLVTNNRSTMPMHLAARLAQGGHVPGIIQLPKQMAIGVIVSSLLLI